MEEEIRTKSLTWVRFKTAVESRKLIIRTPSEDYLDLVETSAVIVGDTFFLSETDKQILAIALQLKSTGRRPQIITDDYSIQNVATQLGIEYASLATYGIRRLLRWMRYCPACHREYPADYASTRCSICGTELKRKTKRLKPIKSKNQQ